MYDSIYTLYYINPGLVQGALASDEHGECFPGTRSLQHLHDACGIRHGDDGAEGHGEVPAPVVGEHVVGHHAAHGRAGNNSRAREEEALPQGPLEEVHVNGQGVGEEQHGNEDEEQGVAVDVREHVHGAVQGRQDALLQVRRGVPLEVHAEQDAL